MLESFCANILHGQASDLNLLDTHQPHSMELGLLTTGGFSIPHYFLHETEPRPALSLTTTTYLSYRTYSICSACFGWHILEALFWLHTHTWRDEFDLLVRNHNQGCNLFNFRCSTAHRRWRHACFHILVAFHHRQRSTSDLVLAFICQIRDLQMGNRVSRDSLCCLHGSDCHNLFASLYVASSSIL